MRDVIICRCEEVTLSQLEEIIKHHDPSARELKLRTRAGMGICGGKTCRPLLDKVLQKLTDKAPTDDIPLKVQPPVRPTSLAQLGGSGDET